MSVPSLSKLQPLSYKTKTKTALEAGTERWAGRSKICHGRREAETCERASWRFLLLLQHLTQGRADERHGSCRRTLGLPRACSSAGLPPCQAVLHVLKWPLPHLLQHFQPSLLLHPPDFGGTEIVNPSGTLSLDFLPLRARLPVAEPSVTATRAPDPSPLLGGLAPPASIRPLPWLRLLPCSARSRDSETAASTSTHSFLSFLKRVIYALMSPCFLFSSLLMAFLSSPLRPSPSDTSEPDAESGGLPASLSPVGPSVRSMCGSLLPPSRMPPS